MPIVADLTPPAERFDRPIALFLDVDGTLVEIEHEPDAVAVAPALHRHLGELDQRLDGALALISGRPIEQLDALFAPLHLNAAGLHGLERRNLRTGRNEHAEPPAGIGRIKQALTRFAAAHPGVMVEDKGVTLALHFRQAPAVEAEATALAETLAEQAEGAVLVLRGKKVLELKPPGIDKGRAVAAFLTEVPFKGRLPVFAGDDVTDEAGFAAVNEVGGLSLRVGADGRTTQARHGLPDVTAMHAWLAALAAAELAVDG